MKNNVFKTGVKCFMLLTICLMTSLCFSSVARAESYICVRDLKQTGHTSRSIRIEYYAPESDDIDLRFECKYSTDKVNWETVYGSIDYAILSGLSPNTTYFVKVVPFIDDDGNKEYHKESEIIVCATGPEGKVKSVKQISQTDKSVKLQWSPVKGANCYVIATDDGRVITVKGTSTKLKVSANTTVTCLIYGCYKSPSNSKYLAITQEYQYISVKPVPYKVVGFGINNISSMFHTIDFVFNNGTAIDGQQIEVYDVSRNKKVYSKNVKTDSFDTKV